MFHYHVHCQACFRLWAGCLSPLTSDSGAARQGWPAGPSPGWIVAIAWPGCAGAGWAALTVPEAEEDGVEIVDLPLVGLLHVGGQRAQSVGPSWLRLY